MHTLLCVYDDIWNRVDNNLQFCKFSEGLDDDDAADRYFVSNYIIIFLNIKLYTMND